MSALLEQIMYHTLKSYTTCTRWGLPLMVSRAILGDWSNKEQGAVQVT